MGSGSEKNSYGSTTLDDMLVAVCPYRDKFYIAVKGFLAIPILFNEKYPKMHEAAKIKLINI
jgi:hypothetical protein